MDLNKRLQQERQTNLGNIIDKPWFLAVVFLIFAAVLGPEIYKHFKKPTVEDCADILYTEYNGSSWSPEYLESSASEKLNSFDKLYTAYGETYERVWNDCERELKEYPKKFKVKYKHARERIENEIKSQKEWMAIKKK